MRKPAWESNDLVLLSVSMLAQPAKKATLLAAKMSEQDLKAIDAEVREVVNAAADFAQHDPEPDAAELYTDIYR